MDSKYFKELFDTKNSELSDAINRINELKIKLISLQTENDDLKSKLMIGHLELKNTIERQKFKIESLEENQRL